MLRRLFRVVGPTFSLVSLVFVSGCYGQQPARSDAAVIKDTGASVDAALQHKLAVWQHRLRLDSWNITLTMAHTGSLRPQTAGNIHWDPAAKTAEIRVLDPVDYRMAYDDMMRDMEFTVVHELLHLELASLPRTDASRPDEEVAVNQIAQALLNLDRQAAGAVHEHSTITATR